MEQVFENRKHQDINRPSLKGQVMNQSLNSVAGQPFLTSLKNQQKEIDKFLS